MAQRLQLRRGSRAEHAVFTGAPGETTYNTQDKRLHTHDGTTPGGTPHLTQPDFNQASAAEASDVPSTLTPANDRANVIVVQAAGGHTAGQDKVVEGLTLDATWLSGRIVTIINDDADPLVLSHEDLDVVTAERRFSCPRGQDVVVPANSSIQVTYVVGATDTRWFVIPAPAGTAATRDVGTGAEQLPRNADLPDFGTAAVADNLGQVQSQRGTWTPVLVNNGTLSFSNIEFRRTGDLVTIRLIGSITVANNGLDLRLSGLPAVATQGLDFGIFASIDSSSDIQSTFAGPHVSGTEIIFTKRGTGGTGLNSDFQPYNGVLLSLTLTYISDL
jgi:hypothetical protein